MIMAIKAITMNLFIHCKSLNKLQADREVYNRTKANIEQRCHQEEKPREVTNNE